MFSNNSKFLSQIFELCNDREFSSSLLNDILYSMCKISTQKYLKHLHESILFVQKFTYQIDFDVSQFDWMFRYEIHLENLLNVIGETFYKYKINNLMKANNETNKSFIDKLEIEFTENDLKSKLFIRALVIVLCNNCLIHKEKLDLNLFKQRVEILKNYLNSNDEFQLETLYAVQALDYQLDHPIGYI